MAFTDLEDGIAEVFDEAAFAGDRYADASLAFGGSFATDGDVTSRLQRKARYWLETLALRDRRPRYRIEPLPPMSPPPKTVQGVRRFWAGPRAPDSVRWTPKDEHRLMLMAVGEELPWDEIAEALGRTRSACITRYADIKARLSLTIHRRGARTPGRGAL